ncbi:PREDICTED: 2',5'-phosphodiesterase 12 [Drosophila arizonae]|uniref:2',5'-phosphodiesterase 12 n=1 Tax=Drosophila arizonae TaxID=7263 RepID=A0ABM1P5D6_DROAR|nr:PREDICTED: 2',5'-phosphodiesterase 12 [Drosophila arizonae]
MIGKFIHCCSLHSLVYQQLRASALSTSLRSLRPHSTAVAMDKVYLRNAQNTEELHITFRYANQGLKLDRSFNFCRRMSERVDEALLRIRNNVEKELTKKSKKKSKGAAAAETPLAITPNEIVVEFRREGSEEQILGVTFEELLKNSADGLKLRIHDTNFDVLLNQPWIDSVQLPSSILAGFPVYPLKLELEFASREHSRAEWYRAVKPANGIFNEKTNWKRCAEGLIYQTSSSDVDHHLKLVIRPGNEQGILGPATECISKLSVLPGPTDCPFEQRHQYTKQPLSDPNAIRVVSYNLLADLYADGDYARKTLFPYCEANALKIDYRKQLFIKELLGYNADLMCLQEVDLKIFEHDLKHVLTSFTGIMTPKGTCAEGIALFYRSTRFELVKNYVLHLGDNISTLPVFTPLWNIIKSNEQLAKRICERSTTLQLSLLQVKETGRYVLVANTHLYFHPDADHIRLLQIGFSLIFVEHIYKQVIKERNITSQNIGLIFCGDFNSVPECGIYKLMTEQFVGKDFVDWSSNEEQAVKDVELRQPFLMSSACGTPPYTNYTTLFAACLDYIFYQRDCFDLLQSVPLPTLEQLSENEAIPSIKFPSDHVALVADLAFKSC